jgi:phosphopantothenoylcysteine decarboxylase / phosphopantothenate---cysteine ligase
LKIILGVSGSIAAYKAAFLTRLLVKDGHEVKVIMTHNATGFITPLTLSTLSKNKVLSELYNGKTGEWVNHVDLANWADLILIAPLSANTLAKMAIGICDNLLLTTYLSAVCPVYIAPAMDREMYQHDSVRSNLAILEKRGNIIIPPVEGELASGLEGIGRMAEPEDIFEAIKKKVLNPDL